MQSHKTGTSAESSQLTFHRLLMLVRKMSGKAAGIVMAIPPGICLWVVMCLAAPAAQHTSTCLCQHCSGWHVHEQYPAQHVCFLCKRVAVMGMPVSSFWGLSSEYTRLQSLLSC